MGALPEFPPAREFIKVKKFQVGFGNVCFNKLMPQVFQKKVARTRKKNLVGLTLKKLEAFIFVQLETLKVQERALSGSSGDQKMGQEKKSGADQSRAKSNYSKRTKREREKAGDMPGQSQTLSRSPRAQTCKRAGWP